MNCHWVRMMLWLNGPLGRDYCYAMMIYNSHDSLKNPLYKSGESRHSHKVRDVTIRIDLISAYSQ